MSHIHPTAIVHPTAVLGPNVQLGAHVQVGPYAVIGLPGFIRNTVPEQFQGRVVIGARTRIGPHVHVAAGLEGETRIGEDCLMMTLVNVGHNAMVGHGCEVGPGSMLLGHCQLEARVRLKAAVVLRTFKRVAYGSTVGMGSVVTKDLTLPHWLYYGNPARAIRPLEQELPPPPSDTDA